MREPTIAIDVRMLTASGIGTCLVNLVPRIVAARPEWSFRLFGRSEELSDYGWSRAPNVAIFPFTSPIYGIAEQLHWPARSVAGSDLVWSPHYNIPLRWRGRLLVTVHDIAHMALPKVYRNPLHRGYAALMAQGVRRRANVIHFDSAFTQAEFTRLIGAPKGASIVVHNGVDESWFRVEPPADRPERPYIVYVGNVKPHKNLGGLLSAFAGKVAEIPHDLLIVGKREGFITGDGRIVGIAERLGARVIFTGRVSDDALKETIAGADALVLPSFYEGFGLPPLEAMACGCPVLVASAASLPEVCGDAALYCDPFDAKDIGRSLVRILTDQVLRTALRAKGRARAARFTWEAATEKHVKTMESLLGWTLDPSNTSACWSK
jgi:glycosyltransferase involved in cell wall biosynthesis